MTTSSDPTNTTHDCVPDCVPDCVSQAARAPASRVRPPSPSTTWGDALSEPSALRPHDRVPDPLGDGAEPHVQQPPAETPWAAVRARLDAATPGPWETVGCYVETLPRFDLHRFDVMGITVARCEQSLADAEFIAHAPSDLEALLAAYDGLVVQLAEVRANRDRLAHQVAAQRTELDDLRSRLGCVLEATSMDRPYDTRIAAIRRMCDLTTNGLTPTSTTSPAATGTTEGA